MYQRITTSLLLASACLLMPLQSIAQPLQTVNLGTAAGFAVLAKAAISTVPPSAITGDIGVSPAAQTFITGFSLTTNTGFATSPQVTGKVYAADQTPPTPSNMTTAIADMELAYVDAAGRSNPDFSEFMTGHLGGAILAPGLYKWTSTVDAASSFELRGSANSVWIFQIAGNLDIAGNVIMTLSGGAQASNVFFQVAGAVTFGPSAQMQGNFMTATAVNFGTGATLLGRALAQTQVVLNQNTIVKPTLVGTSIDNGNGQSADRFALMQNFPNPFNPTTVISYQIAQSGTTKLAVYDLLGREVAVLVNGVQSAGAHSVTFDASNLNSGMYVYHLTSGNSRLTGKMTLVK